MKTGEPPAGVVVFRDEPDVAGGRSFLLLNYGRFWDFPKGHVEKARRRSAAAHWRLDEKRAFAMPINRGLPRTNHLFFSRPAQGPDSQRGRFLPGADKRKHIKLSHEHVGYEFLPFQQATERLTYASAKAILRKARRTSAEMPQSVVGRQNVVITRRNRNCSETAVRLSKAIR